MAIEFACPTCNGTLQVGDDAAGRVIRCGGCLTMLRVPGGDSASSTNASGSAMPPTPVSPFETGPSPSSSRRSRSPSSPTRSDSRPEEPRRRRRERDEYDNRYDDRPRRPRNDTPAPPGRSAFVWVVGIGAVLFLGLLTCCGGMLLLIPKEESHPLQSQNGGFKVELPAKAKPNVQKDIDIGLEKDERIEGTTVFPQHSYVVIYRTIPSTKERSPKGKTDEVELRAAIDELLEATEAKPKPRAKDMKEITVNGFPGRELEFKGRKGFYTARVVIADTKRYIVVAIGPMHEAPVTRKFLESFEITDEKLLAEGKKREKQVDAKKEKEKEKEKEKDDQDNP